MWSELYYHKRNGRKSLQVTTLNYKYVEDCGWCREPFLSHNTNVGNFCCRSCGISCRQTGKPSGMSGRKHSTITINKIIRANTGKVRTLKMRRKYSLSKKAESNPNWQGGITSANDKIRGSLEYREWRNLIFERDNYRCQVCSEEGSVLAAHHIVPFSIIMKENLIDLLFDTENGVTMCKECHKKHHKAKVYKGKSKGK